MASIEVLGENIAEKLAEVRNQQKKQRAARLKVEGVVKESIIKKVKEALQKNPPEIELEYVMDTVDGKNIYNVGLARTGTPEVDVQEFKYGPGVRMFLGDDKITAFNLKPEQIDMLKPDSYYILVGTKNLKPGQHRSFINFNVHDMITMDEVKVTGEVEKTEQQEIAEKVQEHTQPESAPTEPEKVEEMLSDTSDVKSAFDPVETKDATPIGANI